MSKLTKNQKLVADKVEAGKASHLHRISVLKRLRTLVNPSQRRHIRMQTSHGVLHLTPSLRMRLSLRLSLPVLTQSRQRILALSRLLSQHQMQVHRFVQQRLLLQMPRLSRRLLTAPSRRQRAELTMRISM